MPFLNSLVVESVRSTGDRKLVSSLIWQNPVNDSYVAVPIGFVTNYASIPKFVRAIVDNDEGSIRDAAVLHDYLYSQDSVSRFDADYVLRIAMKELGAEWWKRWMVWAAVRLFGWYFRGKDV